MQPIELRPLAPSDRFEAAELICVSTNVWYQTHGRPPIFPGGPETTEVFFDVYQDLDPGCGVVAVHRRSGRMAGLCFVHPRPTHVSLGIMNVHPNYFGCGVARALLQHIIEFAERQGKPLRLVSSAMNLDSFSLYTRAGFVPQTPYQDMFLKVPEGGLPLRSGHESHIRQAVPADVPRIAALEEEVAGIRRDQDFAYFIANRAGYWHVSVYEDDQGEIQGFMASCGHPGCNMIGPGAARKAEQAAALVLAEADRHRGRSPVFLVPMQCAPLVRQMYQWGARNCETHLSQVRGSARPLAGVHMPTFLPESS